MNSSKATIIDTTSTSKAVTAADTTGEKGTAKTDYKCVRMHGSSGETVVTYHGPGDDLHILAQTHVSVSTNQGLVRCPEWLHSSYVGLYSFLDGAQHGFALNETFLVILAPLPADIAGSFQDSCGCGVQALS